VALFEWDLVAWIFGGMEFGETNIGSRIVYGLVGLAAIYCIPRFLAVIGDGRRRRDVA
jgi:uncharacterized protein